MHLKFTPENYDAILEQYNRHGFVVLTDVDPNVATALRREVSVLTGLSDEAIREAGVGRAVDLTPEARARLARPETTPALQEVLVSVFGDLLL